MASKMSITSLVLFSLLFCVELNSVVRAANPQAADDNCVLSFVVPRDKMKSSCDVEEKFRRRMSGVEMKVNVYKHQVNELQTMMVKERELNAEKMENLERTVRESSLNADSNGLLERRLAHLEQEIGRLNNDIVQGRSVHAQNRNAINDHPDYNFNALDQNPVTLPNLVKSMVQSEIQNVMADYTKRFENYVQEQMVIYSKVYRMMADTSGKAGLQGRLNGKSTGHDKYPEIYKETASKSIMNQLNEFQDNIDKTGEEIAKNVNTYLHKGRDTRRPDQGGQGYDSVSDNDRTNTITSSSTTTTTTTTTTPTTNTGGDLSDNPNTTTVDYEEFQMTNASDMDIGMEVNESFSGENPDSTERTTRPTTLTRKADTEVVGSASSRISGGGAAPAKNRTTNTTPSSPREKYEEKMDWKEHMVMDQEYDKAEEEEKLMERVKMLLVHPMAEMMSLVEKQNSQVNTRLKHLQDEVLHNLPKNLNDRLKTADQGVGRNSLQIESVSQAVQDLYVKVDKVRGLETVIHELKENASTSHSNMPVTVNEHEKRVSKLERLTRVYSQSLDHYKNETKQEYKDMRETLMRETLHVKMISKTLQKNVTRSVEKLIDRYNESQAPQMEELKTRMKDYDENILIFKIDLASFQRKLNGKSNKFDRELREIRENVEQFSSNSWDLKRKTDSLNRKFSALEGKVANTSDIIEDLKTEVKLSMTDAWLKINFEFDVSRSECFGDQYVRRSKFKKGGFVGVVLCSPTRYKILLSESLEGKFLNIGDGVGMGEDHCEFVGGSRKNEIILAPWKPVFGSDRGYTRNTWGEEPRMSVINAVKPAPKWYECGVSIP